MHTKWQAVTGHQMATTPHSHTYRHEHFDQCLAEAALISSTEAYITSYSRIALEGCHMEGCSEERQALQAQAKVA